MMTELRGIGGEFTFRVLTLFEVLVSLAHLFAIFNFYFRGDSDFFFLNKDPCYQPVREDIDGPWCSDSAV